MNDILKVLVSPTHNVEKSQNQWFLQLQPDRNHMQGCAQDDLSDGHLLAKVVQNCLKCSISALFMSDSATKLA